MKKRLLTLACLFLTCLLLTALAASRLTITVHGLEKLPDVQKNVTTALDNLRDTLPEPITKPIAKNFYQKAPLEIRKAMEPFGFFHVSIQGHLQNKQGLWSTVWTITPGTPLKITELQIDIQGEGAQDPAFKKLLTQLPLKLNTTFEVPNYEHTKQDLFDLASNHGYFQAKMLKSTILSNLVNNQVKIIIIFDTKKRYRFGMTQLSTAHFSDRFLIKYLAYQPNQPYLNRKIDETQQNFSNSDYFEQVIVNPVTDKAYDYTVPIQIHLRPQKPQQYIFGAGYGTDTGVRGLLGFTQRFLGNSGQNFNALLQASQSNSSLVGSYNIPGSNPLKDLYSISGGIGSINNVSGQSQSAKIAVSYRTLLGDYWQQLVSLGYLVENYNITGYPQTNANLLYPSIQWSYLKYKNKLTADNGINLDINLSGTPDALASNEGFAQAQVNLKTLSTLAATHTRFITRLGGGRTIIENITHLPYSLQLFLGGAQSVRGYQYQQLGPGKNMLVGSVEIQQRLFGQFYVAGFLDAGNVTNSSVLKDPSAGAGPGLVWLSPVGALELTAANAITENGRPWVFQFSMGPTL